MPAGMAQARVLLIEDSEDAKNLVEHALLRHGKGKYHLDWACSLRNGIEKLSHGHVDIVLLDLGLPDTEGAATYSALREAAPAVPVVVISGTTSEETQVPVILGGVSEYLGKEQLSEGLLLEAIRSALREARQRKMNDFAS